LDLLTEGWTPTAIFNVSPKVPSPLHLRADKLSVARSYKFLSLKATKPIDLQNMHGFNVLDHCYPKSFVSNSDWISAWLQVLSNNTLLNSVHGFRANIPSAALPPPICCGSQIVGIPNRRRPNVFGQLVTAFINSYDNAYYEATQPKIPPKYLWHGPPSSRAFLWFANGATVSSASEVREL
jgi:hypothetical protein